MSHAPEAVPHHSIFPTLLKHNSPYSQSVLRVLATNAGLALMASVASWTLHVGIDAPPIYVVNLPLCLGTPLFLLGVPLIFVSAPEPYVRMYSWGAIGLGAALTAAWILFAFLDPHGVYAFGNTGLLFGWMAGGTVYQILLILLIASS